MSLLNLQSGRRDRLDGGRCLVTRCCTLLKPEAKTLLGICSTRLPGIRNHPGFDTNHRTVRLPDDTTIAALDTKPNHAGFAALAHSALHFGQQSATLLCIQGVPLLAQGSEFLIGFGGINGGIAVIGGIARYRDTKQQD